MKQYIKNLLTADDPTDAKIASEFDGIGSEARPITDFTVKDHTGEAASGRLSFSGKDIGASGQSETYAGSLPRELFENHSSYNVQEGESEHPYYYGFTTGGFYNKISPVSFNRVDWFTHVGIFGTTGTGKTTITQNLLTQLMYAGEGFCYATPKETDIIKFARRIPEHRWKDVRFIDMEGAELDKSIGFNLLETMNEPGNGAFEDEIDSMSEVLLEATLAAQGTGGGSIIENVMRTFSQVLMASEYDMCLSDMLSLLQVYREEDRSFTEILDHIPEENVGKSRYSIMKTELEELDKHDPEEFSAARRRVVGNVAKRGSRAFFGKRQSDFSFQEAVDDNLIIVINIKDNDELQKRLMVTMFTRQLWKYMNSREGGEKENQQNAFFLIVDEFPELLADKKTMKRIFSIGRALGLGAGVIAQSPSQLPSDVRQEMETNIATFLSYDTGDKVGQQTIADELGLDSSERLSNLPDYTLLNRVKLPDGTTLSPVEIQAFAPYPPLYSKEEAMGRLRETIKEHGSVPPELDATVSPFENRQLDSEDETVTEDSGEPLIKVTKTGEEVTLSTFLNSIYNALLQTGGEDGAAEWTPASLVAEKLRRVIGDDESLTIRDAGQLHEETPDGYIKFDTMEGDGAYSGSSVYFKLTERGLDYITGESTGESGSAGGIKHRHILKECSRIFRRMGYQAHHGGNIELVTQGGTEEKPDLIVTPQYEPYQYRHNQRIQQATEKLKREVPRGVELFSYNELAVEAESSGFTKPAKPLKNLRKAIDNQQFCVFAVLEQEGDYGAKALEGYRKLTQPVFGMNKDSNGHHYYYNTDNILTIGMSNGDEVIPLIHTERDTSQSPRSMWKYDPTEDEYYLEHPDTGEKEATFNTPSDIFNSRPPSAAQNQTYEFNHYLKSNGDGKYDLFSTKYDTRGGRVTEGVTIDDAKSEGFFPRKTPFIPSREFADYTPKYGRDFRIIVVPKDNSSNPPANLTINKNGEPELEPLFEEDYFAPNSGDEFSDLESGTDDDDSHDDTQPEGDDEEFDSLNQAAMDGVTENEGVPPEFRDERGKESEPSGTEVTEDTDEVSEEVDTAPDADDEASDENKDKEQVEETQDDESSKESSEDDTEDDEDDETLISEDNDWW